MLARWGRLTGGSLRVFRLWERGARLAERMCQSVFGWNVHSFINSCTHLHAVT